MKQLIVKMTDDDFMKLDTLCGIYGENRSSLIRSFIAEQYDMYQGNPELKKLFAQMQEIGKTVEGITGKKLPNLPEIPDVVGGAK